MPKELLVFLMAMIPVVERAAIPTGIGFHVPPAAALFLGIAGNLVPVAPLLLFLEPVSRWLAERIAFFKRLFDWLFEHTRKRHSERMERYGVAGIFIVTAIPAPGMGPWTGCLIAFLFGTDFWPSMLAIIGGTLVACSLLLAGSLGFAAFSRVSSPLVSGIILLALIGLGYLIWRGSTGDRNRVEG